MSNEAQRGTDDVRALAEAVADVLEERGLLSQAHASPGPVLKVADVAQLLGRSQAWVYDHAAELGAFKFGNGPKARIGFDRDAIERWKRDRQILKSSGVSRPASRRGRPRKSPRPGATNLIPYDPSPYRA
jgi:predicted DNA-binding transcriptional regulator AlpA